MTELKTQGIVLKAIDYGEKDKIITIFTQEYGKVSAILKGVRKLTSKLKFASQPFCYAQFNLVGRAELMNVNNASEILSFFDITQNYAKMVCGSAMLEMVEYASPVGQSEPIVFDALRTCLKLLSDTDLNPDLVLMRFAIGLFKVSGYTLNLHQCARCGKSFDEDKAVFDLDSGSFLCYKCPAPRFITVSPRCVEIMQKIARMEPKSLEDIFLMDSEAKEFRRLVRANFELRFGVQLKSLNTAFD